jgi:hypothetical protein
VDVFNLASTNNLAITFYAAHACKSLSKVFVPTLTPLTQDPERYEVTVGFRTRMLLALSNEERDP